MVAHHNQLHPVPEHLEDRVAVLIEPMACALHAVREAKVPPGSSVVVIGAGTIGLLTVLALRTLTAAGPVYVVAKYGHQRERAVRLGATAVLSPERTARALRLAEGGTLHTPEIGTEYLLGGVDVAFECTGGGPGLDQALRVVRAGGTVVLSGMPAGPVDLTPLWFRQLNLRGAYASDSGADARPGSDPEGASGDSRRAEFALAIETIEAAGPNGLSGHVDAVYPLARWREALSHAIAAGRWGTGKVALNPSHD
jgi:threonine dehydrogenase-like Zn-dependent dehydrogenase